MINFISGLIPLAVLGSNVVALVVIAALFARRSWGRGIVEWIGHYALSLGFAISLAAVLGSLFYSNVSGFTPCVLCWWQRIGIFPTLVLFAVALKNHDRGVFKYILPLGIITSVIAVYNSYIQWGGNPLIPCDAAASCTKIYVNAYGYLTIPTMSLSIALLLIILYFVNRVYENRNA